MPIYHKRGLLKPKLACPELNLFLYSLIKAKGDMRMEPTQWWGHGFGFMWLIPLLFIVVMLFCMRGMFGKGSPGCGSHRSDTPDRESAREILDQRFAKGEITREEYKEMKMALDNKTS
jgi:putative membrane protein